MATRKELKELALLRLSEAETLFAAGLYDGAGYICGYVLELALKARFAGYSTWRSILIPAISGESTQRTTSFGS